MLTPIKLWKTRKLADSIQSAIKEMTMKNWTTAVPGIIIALLSIALLWVGPQYHDKLAQTIAMLTGVFTALGLLAAKSANNHSTVAQVEEATAKEKDKQLGSV